MKQCAKCKKNFPATREFFYSDGVRQGGKYGPYLKSWCKTCSVAHVSKMYRETGYGEKSRQSSRKRARIERLWVLSEYSAYPPRCACCGEDTYRFLTLDHKNNDGAEHRRAVAKETGATRVGNSGLYRWLINRDFPEGFQVLCYNCNCAKGFWGSCPHAQPVDYIVEAS